VIVIQSSFELKSAGTPFAPRKGDAGRALPALAARRHFCLDIRHPPHRAVLHSDLNERLVILAKAIRFGYASDHAED
jgi:hypothetical protein